MDIPHWKYKRPSGTRWVEHQASNINLHNHNLPILIGFFNQQISQPHNASIKKIKADLEGYRSNICNVDRIVFSGAKQDVLNVVQPLSKVMQENSLIMPSIITSCAKTLKSIGKLNEIILTKGPDAFKDSELFPHATR